MEKDNSSRRRFIKNTTLATVSALTIPQLLSSVYAEDNGKKFRVTANNVILFQGDSITDSGRKKDNFDPNNAAALGGGYAMIAASEMLFKHAALNLTIYNRGISGNKVYQLAERWDRDALELKPDVLSILVGVNDFWHTLVNNYKGTIKTYNDDLVTLLDRTKQKLPAVKMIIGEPYAVKGIRSVDEKWYPAFNDYRHAAKEIAKKYDAVFIPYQAIYEKAMKEAPGVYWTHDGVHPSLAGAHLMAHAWLSVVKF